MEYLLGSIMTIALLIISKKFFIHPTKTFNNSEMIRSQSNTFTLIKPYLQMFNFDKKIVTQSSKHTDSQYVRVVLVDHKAYWISNNTFFVADEIDGAIDKESAKPVDTMGMDKVQLDKMMFIVETLTEGEGDEHWSTGQ